MSANIYWKPKTKNGTDLGVLAPSKFQEQMSDAGLRLPCVVGVEHLQLLRGLAVAWGLNDENNPYVKLMDLLDKFNAIELTAVY